MRNATSSLAQTVSLLIGPAEGADGGAGHR
jgi:hypothetical protein